MIDRGARARLVEAFGSRLEEERAMGPLTTYRVGGPAALFLVAEDVGDLAAAAAAAGGSVEVLVVGRGSNLLVADAGVEALVVQLGEGFAGIDVDGTTVRAGGAALLPVVARRTAAAGLRGFEWAVGVPGSVGGAVRMNAGGHGSDMAAALARVRVFDLSTGDDEWVDAAALDLGYRRSAIGADQVVVTAELRLRTGDQAAALAEIDDIVRWRRSHQPGGPNAGSVFTNPPGDSAGRLIDDAGARGLRWGSAQVSEKHANFIQADPGGSADDVARLMIEVRRRVSAHAGVELVPETRLAGHDPAVLADLGVG